MANPPNPPAIRTIDAASVRSDHLVTLVQQPGEKADYAVDFTKLLPAGYGAFVISGVTYGTGQQAASPVALLGVAYIYIDTTGITSGTTGVISVLIGFNDPAGVALKLECSFVLDVRDQ